MPLVSGSVEGVEQITPLTPAFKVLYQSRLNDRNWFHFLFAPEMRMQQRLPICSFLSLSFPGEIQDDAMTRFPQSG